MNGWPELMQEMKERGVHATLFVPTLGQPVINIQGLAREIEKADVDACRAAFERLGYREVGSWIAVQGASWMSDGVPSVSFRLIEQEARG